MALRIHRNGRTKDTVTGLTGSYLGERLVRAILGGALAVGALLLWFGIPSAVLWTLGKLTDSSTQHFVLGMIVVPISMVAFGVCLILLNWAYMNVGKSRRSELLNHTHRGQGPLAHVLILSVVINVTALVIWFVLFAHSSMPAMPGAW
jgi:hypothetical protein